MKSSYRKFFFGILLLLLVFSGTPLLAEHILVNESLIKDKTAEKIEEMANEVQEKTGVGLYVMAVQLLKEVDSARELQKQIAPDLPTPNFILFVSALDKRVAILPSEDMKGKLELQKILDFPINNFFRKAGKGAEQSTEFSAGIFFAMTALADETADLYKVKLESLPYDPKEEQSRTDDKKWTRRTSALGALAIFVIFTIGFILYKKRKG